jgi:hypothetical protein
MKTNKPKVYRHGEICFEAINELPGNLVKSNTKEFLKGSHGNPHTFDNGELYLKKENEIVFGYFKAENTTLFHCEHSLNGVSLPNGNYKLRRQIEFVNNEMQTVKD